MPRNTTSGNAAAAFDSVTEARLARQLRQLSPTNRQQALEALTCWAEELGRLETGSNYGRVTLEATLDAGRIVYADVLPSRRLRVQPDPPSRAMRSAA